MECADICDKKRITIFHCQHGNMQRSDQGLGRVHRFVELGVGPSRGQKVAFFMYLPVDNPRKSSSGSKMKM
jgi:hypothetical protein